MLTEERRNQIIHMLHTQNSIQVDRLSEFFDVSLATVRRDLAELEKQGYLRRVYGGAVSLKKPIASTDAFNIRSMEKKRKKLPLVAWPLLWLSRGTRFFWM